MRVLVKPWDFLYQGIPGNSKQFVCANVCKSPAAGLHRCCGPGAGSPAPEAGRGQSWPRWGSSTAEAGRGQSWPWCEVASGGGGPGGHGWCRCSGPLLAGQRRKLGNLQAKETRPKPGSSAVVWRANQKRQGKPPALPFSPLTPARILCRRLFLKSDARRFGLSLNRSQFLFKVYNLCIKPRQFRKPFRHGQARISGPWHFLDNLD